AAKERRPSGKGSAASRRADPGAGPNKGAGPKKAAPATDGSRANVRGQGRGLARAVGADQTHDLSGPQLEREPTNGVDCSVAHREVLECQGSGHSSSSAAALSPR